MFSDIHVIIDAMIYIGTMAKRARMAHNLATHAGWSVVIRIGII